MLIDSHAHIYDEEYGEDGARTIACSMAADGLDAIVCVGCDMPTSRTCVDIASKYQNVYATVGVHPYDSATVTEAAISELRELARSSKVVAIGEIGIDLHRPGSDCVDQVRAMIAQYELARELKLPQVYHIRDGFAPFYDFAKDREFPQGAVLHCFSGSAELAELYIKKGFYISFSGTVTYKNAVNLVRAATVVPLDRLLIETDSPYLTPEPHRGHINYPKYVAHVRDRIAQIKGVPAEEVGRATAENAKRIFAIG